MASAPTTTQTTPSGMWIPATTVMNTGSADGISIPARVVDPVMPAPLDDGTSAAIWRLVE